MQNVAIELTVEGILNDNKYHKNAGVAELEDAADSKSAGTKYREGSNPSSGIKILSKEGKYRMCGIVGYIGNKDVDSVILVGLEKLEYRGYDSAGIAAIHEGNLFLRKKKGRIVDLYSLVNGKPIKGNVGIGHTRWATHGKVTDENAHPHTDCTNTIAVVHNGIIENYIELKEELISKGHVFKSETDSEVIPHIIEGFYRGDFLDAILKTVKKLQGAFAFVAISTRDPDKIIGVRMASPLILGVGENEMLFASDIPALLSHTKKIIPLEDGEIVVATQNSYRIFDFDGNEKIKEVTIVTWEADMVEKEGFPHYMLKEIHEQPKVFVKNIANYIKSGEPQILKDFNLRRILLNKNEFFIQASGTSLHAGMIGTYMLQNLARIKSVAEYSSEFRYKNPVFDPRTLVVAISQSGETADTLAGVRLAKANGLDVLSIVNVQESTIARESDYVVYINAGPEIGVASTKAYTAQLLILALLSLEIGYLKGFIPDDQLEAYVNELKKLPEKMRSILAKEAQIQHIAEKFYNANNFMFLGRGINYPTALEGALKLKEISYIHATGYAAGEMKHGPIALVDENLPVVVVAPQTSVYAKTISNIQEVRARGGRIIIVATEGDEKVKDFGDEVIYVPDTFEIFTPILSIIPLQLLAYHIAVLRNCDVDKPRNLAKSVTVE